MARWIKWLLILLVVAAGLMAGLGLVLRSLVSGSAKDKLIASLSEKMGVPIGVTGVDFDLSQWFRLRPAVSLQEVSVGNPPGFRSKNLFEAKKISAQVSLGALMHKAIDVRSFRIEEPHIAVETNAHGRTNVGELLSKVSSSPGSGGGSNASLSVDEFVISNGSLAISGAQSVNIQGIDIKLSNFSQDRRCHLEASAKLFGGGSGFKLDGQAGPFASESLPLEGTLNINVAVASIPEAMRREQFGKLLASPGSSAKANIEATVKGDLYGSLSGPAKLVLTSIRIGPDDSHALPLSGETNATIAVAGVMSSPRFDLKVPDARLQFGKGEWTGGAEFQSHGEATSGGVHGAVRNVDINELLSSFTTSSGKIYGLLAIPSFTLQFAGKNAAELHNSLHGNAKLSVTQGKLGALDLLASIERALGQANQDTEGAKGTTAFNTLSSDLTIGHAQIEVANLLLDGPALKAEGNGVIGFDHALNFNLVTHVSGNLARLVNTATFQQSSSGTSDLPLTVTGTTDSPRVRPNIKKVAPQVVKGLVDSFLKKKFGK
ncbi:MAG TPA: AsmA-like C-terminal region-containing protein [Bryobacteraceae bacterium]|nr:AsmA-like C-terminal region-containing protein [Bryobacteraceae bacterium]